MKTHNFDPNIRYRARRAVGDASFWQPDNMLLGCAKVRLQAARTSCDIIKTIEYIRLAMVVTRYNFALRDTVWDLTAVAMYRKQRNDMLYAIQTLRALAWELPVSYVTREWVTEQIEHDIATEAYYDNLDIDMNCEGGAQ